MVAILTPKFHFLVEEAGDLLVSIGSNEDETVEIAKFPFSFNPEIWTMFPTAPELHPEQSDSASQDQRP